MIGFVGGEASVRAAAGRGPRIRAKHPSVISTIGQLIAAAVFISPLKLTEPIFQESMSLLPIPSCQRPSVSWATIPEKNLMPSRAEMRMARLLVHQAITFVTPVKLGTTRWCASTGLLIIVDGGFVLSRPAARGPIR